MIKPLIAILIATLSAVLIADSAKDLVIRNPDGSIKRFTKEEFKKLPVEVQRAMGREFFRTRLGEKVIKPGSSKGMFKVICATDLIDIDALSSSVQPIRKQTRIQIEAVKSSPLPDLQAMAVLKKHSAQAGIILVDSENLPRLMLAPEEGWAVINVKALNSQLTEKETLAKRVNVEIIRAFTYVCGAATDARSGLIMQPITAVEQLDDIPNVSLQIANADRMVKQLALWGIEPLVIAYYRKACEEGWAPPPTNDVQKSIYAEVNAEKERGPSNAILIKP